jgi:hypothetical protein
VRGRAAEATKQRVPKRSICASPRPSRNHLIQISEAGINGEQRLQRQRQGGAGGCGGAGDQVHQALHQRRVRRRRLRYVNIHAPRSLGFTAPSVPFRSFFLSFFFIPSSELNERDRDDQSLRISLFHFIVSVVVFFFYFSFPLSPSNSLDASGVSPHEL